MQAALGIDDTIKDMLIGNGGRIPFALSNQGESEVVPDAQSFRERSGGIALIG